MMNARGPRAGPSRPVVAGDKKTLERYGGVEVRYLRRSGAVLQTVEAARLLIRAKPADGQYRLPATSAPATRAAIKMANRIMSLERFMEWGMVNGEW